MMKTASKKPAPETRLLLCRQCEQVHDGQGQVFPNELPANCDGIIKGFLDCYWCAPDYPARYREDISGRRMTAGLIALVLLHAAGLLILAMWKLNS